MLPASQELREQGVGGHRHKSDSDCPAPRFAPCKYSQTRVAMMMMTMVVLQCGKGHQGLWAFLAAEKMNDQVYQDGQGKGTQGSRGRDKIQWTRRMSKPTANGLWRLLGAQSPLWWMQGMVKEPSILVQGSGQFTGEIARAPLLWIGFRENSSTVAVPSLNRVPFHFNSPSLKWLSEMKADTRKILLQWSVQCQPWISTIPWTSHNEKQQNDGKWHSIRFQGLSNTICTLFSINEKNA